MACSPPDDGRGLRPGPLWLFVGALAAAWLLRTVDLPLKPLHSDEGVNGWYSLRLWWTGYYHYQPSDYHGPMMYFVNLVMFWLAGGSDVTLRLAGALTGVLGVGTLALARRPLGGWVGVAAAALLLALLPVDVYFARTAIHEVYLATGTLVFVAAGLRWLRDGGAGWMVLSALALAVMFANKETALLTLCCVAGAVGVVWLLLPWLRDGLGGRSWPSTSRAGALRWARTRWRQWAVALACFWVVLVLLFSSFFTYVEGTAGIFTSYVHWVGYGVSGRNQKKDLLYWAQFWPYVWPALIAGGGELLVGAWRRERTTWLLGTWFLLTLGVYSAIPYKTPWCFVNISLPLVWLAGRGVARAAGALERRGGRIAGAAVLVAWLAMLVPFGVSSYRQNFERYDDDALPYVYVQTVREYLGLVELMRAVGDHSGDPTSLTVVAIDAKNPLRWYLYTDGWEPDNFRYYKGWPGEKQDWPEWREQADIFVCRDRHAAKLRRVIGDGYHEETFPYRPGRRVTAFVPEALMPSP